MANENYINHIALVLDASYSMQGRQSDVIRVADEQIKYLAQRSQELDQETRVTVYTFADDVICHIYDKDVLRLPSMRGIYELRGNTALIDATLLSQKDLAMQPEKYGDHSFLTFVLTDGEDNRSKNYPSSLQAHLNGLPDHWTVAALVPNRKGEDWCRKVGFTPGNISVWDATTSQGLFAAGDTIRRATDQFMVNRASGIRGTRSMFSTGSEAVNSTTIHKAGLRALGRSSYTLLDVNSTMQIRDLVEANSMHYRLGAAYYQLNKTETIQARKEIAVVEKATGNVFVGSHARDIVGLPDYETRVKPTHNPLYDVFVQSTSVNRKLVPGTRLLVLR